MKNPIEWDKYAIPRVSTCVPVPAQNVFLAGKYSAEEKNDAALVHFHQISRRSFR